MKSSVLLVRLANAVLIVLLLAGVPTSARAESPSTLVVQIPFSQMAGSQPLRLDGFDSAVEVEIPTSRSWFPAADITLVVQAAFSAALDPRTSSLTFSINDKPVASLPLSALKSGGTPVTLPRVYFSHASNRLGVAGRLTLRTDAQTGCRDRANPDRWVAIDPESTLLLTLNRQDASYTLEDFPAPFQNPEFDQQGARQIPTFFILPDQPSTQALNSLAAAAFAFGRAQPDRAAWDLSVIPRSQLADRSGLDGNLVFLGGTQQGWLSIDDTTQDAIALQPSPFDPRRAALVIHDADPADGSRPELALVDNDGRPALSGLYAPLAAAAPSQPPTPTWPNPLTFQNLGYNSRTVQGEGASSLIYRLYLPYPLQVKSAELDLDLSHSNEAAQGQSQARVYLNGLTIGTILLSDASAEPGRIHIDLPVKDFRPGDNYLRFTFDLRLAAATCDPQNRAAWATVMNTTQLSILTAARAPQPTLGDFPQPFSDLESAILVLPDTPDLQTLERVARLAVLLGQNAQPEARPPAVLTASSFDAASQSKRHLILIGTPQQNPALRAANNLLPQPFNAEGTRLAPGYGRASSSGLFDIVSRENQALATGLVETARLPWEPDHRILAITGTNPDSFLDAFDRLLSGALQRPGLDGNVMASHPGTGEASIDTAWDAGNLPLLGPFFQSVNLPGVGLPLAALFFGLNIVLIAVLCIRLPGHWQAVRSQPDQPITEERLNP